MKTSICNSPAMRAHGFCLLFCSLHWAQTEIYRLESSLLHLIWLLYVRGVCVGGMRACVWAESRECQCPAPRSLLYSPRTRFLCEPVVRLTANRVSEPPITPPAPSGEAKDMAMPGCLSGHWGFELRSPCLHSKHTHLQSHSPAPTLEM